MINKATEMVAKAAGKLRMCPSQPSLQALLLPHVGEHSVPARHIKARWPQSERRKRHVGTLSLSLSTDFLKNHRQVIEYKGVMSL